MIKNKIKLFIIATFTIIFPSVIAHAAAGDVWVEFAGQSNQVELSPNTEFDLFLFADLTGKYMGAFETDLYVDTNQLTIIPTSSLFGVDSYINLAPIFDQVVYSLTPNMKSNGLFYFNIIKAAQPLVGDGNGTVTTPSRSFIGQYRLKTNIGFNAATNINLQITQINDAVATPFTQTITGATVTPPLANQAPTITAISGTTTPLQGTSYTYTATTADAEDATLSFSVDWGDGTTEATSTPTNGLQTVSHIFTTVANYIISFFVQDSSGSVASSTLTVSVGSAPDNTAPILEVSSAVQTPTNNTTPTFTFTSTEVGTITYGGDCTATTANAIIGSNTITLIASTTAPYDLAEGIHNNCTVQVTDTSTNLNASNILAVPSFEIDTTLPNAPVVTDPATATLTSSSTSLTFSGAGEDGATVSVSGPSNTNCSNVVSGGTWTCTIAGLSDGANQDFIVSQTDPSGNISATSVTRTVSVDTTAPTITLSPAATTMNILVGEAYSAPTATCVDNIDASCTVIVGGDTVSTSTSSTYSVTFDAVDTAGNAAAQLTLTVNVTTGNAPNIIITGGTPINIEVGNTYTDAGATVTDTEDDAASLAITVASTTNVDAGAVGTYQVTYTATDSNNNTTETTRVVNVADTLAPTITLTGSGTPTYTAGDTYTEDGAVCSDINGTYTGTCTVNTSYPAGISHGGVLSAGDYTITYTATDDDNTTSNKTVSVTRTVHVNGSGSIAIPTGLSLQSTSDTATADGITSDNTPTFDISCSVNGSILTLYNNGTDSIATTTCSVGNITFTDVNLSDGMYQLTVKESANSMISDASSLLTVIIDTTNPDIGAMSPSSTTDTTPTLSISITDTNSIGSVTIGGQAAIQSGAIWTATMPTQSIGSHSITIVATDIAGNMISTTRNLTITSVVSTSSGGSSGGSSSSRRTTYSWYEPAWGVCTNGAQTRKVRCKSSRGNYREDYRCSGTKPVETQSCTGGVVVAGTSTSPATTTITTTGNATTTDTTVPINPALSPAQQISIQRPVIVAGLQTAQCPHFTQSFKLGQRGDEVFKIQTFLKEQGFYNGLIGGYYGPLTKKGVEAFQSRYASDILYKVDLTRPTGNWFVSTRAKANDIAGCNIPQVMPSPAQTQLYIPQQAGSASLQSQIAALLEQVKALQLRLTASRKVQVAPTTVTVPVASPTATVVQQKSQKQANTNLGESRCPYFVGNYDLGDRGEGVMRIQKFLTWQGIYDGLVGGYYGPRTQRAVRDFQARYPEILSNAGIFTPTGNWYGSTRLKANKLAGCR